MDFATIWKAGSIIITGAFGVLGLATEFRHHQTRKITKWGYIALGGIVLSTILGTAAQIVDASHAERDKLNVEKQTLELAKKSDTTLQQVERALTSIDGMSMETSFAVACDLRFRRLCGAAVADLVSNHGINHARAFTPTEVESRIWRQWPIAGARTEISYYVLFFKDYAQADAYPEGSDSMCDLSLHITAQTNREGSGAFHISMTTAPQKVWISHLVSRGQYNIDFSDGKIISRADLARAGVIVTGVQSGGKMLPELEPSRLYIRLKDGEDFDVIHLKKKTWGNDVGYVGRLDWP